MFPTNIPTAPAPGPAVGRLLGTVATCGPDVLADEPVCRIDGLTLVPDGGEQVPYWMVPGTPYVLTWDHDAYAWCVTWAAMPARTDWHLVYGTRPAVELPLDSVVIGQRRAVELDPYCWYELIPGERPGTWNLVER